MLTNDGHSEWPSGPSPMGRPGMPPKPIEYSWNHSLDRLHRVLQRGERLGLGPDDPVGQPAGNERPGDLQHLAEAAYLFDPAQHADGLVVRRGRGLGAVGAAGPLVDQQHVGEGAADVDTEPVTHEASSLLLIA
jgi:hypothetical protein